MAFQLESEELKGCKSYFEWLKEKLSKNLGNNKFDNKDTNGKIGKELGSNKFGSKITSENLGSESADSPLLRLLFEKDFVTVESVEDAVSDAGDVIWLSKYLESGRKFDETQAANGMDLRRRYAEDVGKKADKSERDIDRIWKSIHGKCSVLELLLHMCFRLDEMTNEEEEPGSTVPMFFGILMTNLGLKNTDDKDKWNEILGVFLERKYACDGSGGGLFPLQNWSISGGSRDQREVGIWSQMNNWLNENLDEEGFFRKKV